MTASQDTNADIWKSGDIVASWASEAAARQRAHGSTWQLMSQLLPFADDEQFTFLDLGAGTGAASQAILAQHPRATAVLADFSAQMMGAGKAEMSRFDGRYSYVEFDLTSGDWPADIPRAVDAVVTSLCVHHLQDDRKQGLFAEIFARLVPGGWYLNYDPVSAEDPVVASTWDRVTQDGEPGAAHRHRERTPEEQARYENHVRYIIPLDRQLGYLRDAGFSGVDVHFKRLDWVVYGGYRAAG